jgi:hypothetical protein
MSKDEAKAIQALGTAVIDRLTGYGVGSDRLIQLGLDALIAGVDSPTLPLCWPTSWPGYRSRTGCAHCSTPIPSRPSVP